MQFPGEGFQLGNGTPEGQELIVGERAETSQMGPEQHSEVGRRPQSACEGTALSSSESSGLMRTYRRRSRRSAETSSDSLRSKTRGWDVSARITIRLTHVVGVISSAAAAALMARLISDVTVAWGRKCRVANEVSFDD